MTLGQMIRNLVNEYTEELENMNRFHLYQQGSYSTKQERNALNFIAPGIDKKDIVFLVDSTLWQSGKEGMVFTEDTVYWRTMYDEDTRGAVPYVYLKELSVKRSYLMVNGNRCYLGGLGKVKQATQELLCLIRDQLPELQEQAHAEEEQRPEAQEDLTCPGCGGAAEYMKKYRDWYCWSCERYLGMEGQGNKALEGQGEGLADDFEEIIQRRAKDFESLNRLYIYQGKFLPEKKYRKLYAHVALVDQDEILLFVDATVLSSGKAGIVFCEDRILWSIGKAHPMSGVFYYEDLFHVYFHEQKEGDGHSPIARVALGPVVSTGIVVNNGALFIPSFGTRETMVGVLRLLNEIKDLALRQKAEEEQEDGLETEGHPCPDCGQMLEYIQEYQEYYCHECESYPFAEE